MKSNYPAAQTSLLGHSLFLLLTAAVLLVVFALMRGLLIGYNADVLGDATAAMVLESFVNGLRFDLRLAVFMLVPLILATLSSYLIQFRRSLLIWLSALTAISLLLSIIELDFYREFHQRLNSIFFQYLNEDPKTVLSMLWHGFPVVKLLSAWLALSALVILVLFKVEQKTRITTVKPAAWWVHLLVFVLILLLAVSAGRGTLRQGAPLRWGDAFTTSSVFLNHMGLNPVLSLADAARNSFSDHRNNTWKSTMDDEQALTLTRELLLTANDQLVDEQKAAVRRIYQAPEQQLPIRNVVVILMESFAGRYVGALGGEGQITPYFDALSQEGLLFTQFFSSGTHTHQGMFASMTCFPNLPAFEYLMQTPEGGHAFSGLPQLLKARGYQNIYVYNGDFAWDNQQGFFGNQGMTQFVGRYDFIDPVFADMTWGVSDQDMFARAVQELNQMHGDKPFYALLQTLSNHTPYALPTPLPVEAVTGFGSRDEHLTAMRYADWALGQFFAEAKQQPWYQDTLFVVLGDHGFGAPEQLTEMDLYRFYTPMLLLAPNIQAAYGKQNNIVASHVDMVPTVMGLLGQETQQQCWGRDLLHLPENDSGFAIIKPSGGEQTVAMIRDSQILIKPKGLEAKKWHFNLTERTAKIADKMDEQDLNALQRLYAYLQTATKSLLENTTGNK